MARNGSGTYNLPAGNPVVTGTTISSTWANSTLSDIASALTGSVAADGQTVISSNLPMNGYAHTGVGDATVRTMYAATGQVQDNTASYLTSVSGTNTITATASFGMTAYATGQRFTFIAAGSNTGAATLNINAIGAKAITKNGATALSSGDIPSGKAVEVVYDGTQFQLITGSAYTGLSTVNGIVKGDGAGIFSAAAAGVDYAGMQNIQTFYAPQAGNVVTMVTLPFNLASRNNFQFTTTGADTIDFASGIEGQSGYCLLINTSGYAMSIGANVKVDANFATTVSTAGTYLISYFVRYSNTYCTVSGKLS